MTDTKLITNIIKESGLKYKVIAKRTGITCQSLNRKIKNESDFRSKEIAALCHVLNINDLNLKEAIFFAPDVELNSTKETA